MLRVTNALIRQGCSKRGGWNKKQLAILGIECPARKGWRKRAIGKPITEEDARRFVELAGSRKSKGQGRITYPTKVSVKRRRILIADDEEERIRLVAGLHGIQLMVSLAKIGGKSSFPHWRFVRCGFDLLHWWPSSETYLTKDGAKGEAPNAHLALLLACWLVDEVDREEVEELIEGGVLTEVQADAQFKDIAGHAMPARRSTGANADHHHPRLESGR